MKLNFAIFFAFCSVFFMCSEVKADIYSTKAGETHYIRVVRGSTPSKVAFELCSMVERRTCPLIGGKEFSVNNLKAKKNRLMLRSAGTFALELASLAALPQLGMVAGAAASLLAGPAVSVGGAMWVGMGAGLVYHLGVIAKKLNPKVPFDTAKLIKNDVLSDENVYIDTSILKYARELDALLRPL